jgi:hypothetical protein
MKLYIHTITYFHQVKVFPKVINTHLYILTKRKLNKKFSKVYTSHGSPCDFTCIIKCKDFSHDFHINNHVKVKQYDQIIIKL